MSIVGHGIQTCLANVHVALRQQLAGQVAQSEEETRRHIRVRREEELAREAVRRAQETRDSRARRFGQDEADSEDARRRAEETRGGGRHVDLFA